MSSRTPGDLGVYGFRNRSDHSYDGLFIANGTAIKEPRLWDLATRGGKRSIVLGVPGTYPPRPLNGVMVTCFLTPSVESQYTYPSLLKREIESVVGEYLFDTKDFRTDKKDWLLEQIYEMTKRRFALAEHLLRTKPWELFVMVEMGPDRMHHGFWKDMDAEHRAHEPGGAYENAILDYHLYLDGLIGGVLAHADEDTAVLVVSDHGAKRMDGGIRINEWLRREGLLVLTREPQGAEPLHDVGIDWSRTTAWATAATTPASSSTSRAASRKARSSLRTTSASATTCAAGSRRSRTSMGTRSARAPTPGGAVRVGRRRRSRPDRPLRRPALALGRHDRRRRGHPHLRERHRPGRREPRPGRPADHARIRRRAGAARGHEPARRRADGVGSARAARPRRDARDEPARPRFGYLTVRAMGLLDTGSKPGFSA